MWANETGPVVLASDIGGFVEQIIDGETGFIFKAGDYVDLAHKIELIISLPEKRHAQIRRSAASKVIKERDFGINFQNLLFSVRIDK